jgi:hypothetical protein
MEATDATKRLGRTVAQHHRRQQDTKSAATRHQIGGNKTPTRNQQDTKSAATRHQIGGNKNKNKNNKIKKIKN